MAFRRHLLSSHCRDELTRWALTKGAQTMRLDDLATQLRVSRTPVREAARDLEMIGLVHNVRYVGFRPSFLGPHEMQQRTLILGSALLNGFPPAGLDLHERIATCAHGSWAAYSWDALQAWPECAHQWGIDLRPHSLALARIVAKAEQAETPEELGSAVLALHEVLLEARRN
ncbi:GntR family transcriptional regulator [Curtobacterium sp. 20TX0008]|uniref:GntR family transcriptional regulator n=1 Tax=Curtobacterium sp. 20TX0008 TaxID=3022018 RepID=UPI003FA4245E